MAATTANETNGEGGRYTKYGVEPLWEVMQSMVPKAPIPKAEVAIWKYKTLRPLLLEAGQSISAEEAERRVLMLKNPALRKLHKVVRGRERAN